MHSVSRSTPAHIAWLLPVGTLFFSCGILLGRIIPSWHAALIMGILFGIAALVSTRKRQTAALLMLVISVGALVGWFGYHPAMPPEGPYTVRGTIIQEAAWTPGGQVQTVLADVTLNGTPQPNAYWTYYLNEDEVPPDWLVPGAQVEMTATVYHPSLQDNPGGFHFREYLLQRGIRFGVFGRDGLRAVDDGFSLQGWLSRIRHRTALQLMDVMGDEAGAYAAAMLLGTQDFIPQDDRAAFTELGITHILCVSGYHVGVLVAMMLILLRPIPLSRLGRMCIESIVLGLYCLFSGGNAPVIRAACLLLWWEYTRLRNRQHLPLHLLCVTALVQLIFNPTQLTSASFQLTYSAMLGLQLVQPWLVRQKTFRSSSGQKLWAAFCAALSAQLGILFPQLYWFGHLPLASILLNMALLPFFTGLIQLYWMMLMALPVPGLRTLLGAACTAATELLLTVVRYLASLNLASLWTRQADVFTFLGWALLIFAASAYVPRKLAQYRRRLLLLGSVLVALILLPLPENTTTYTQFSVANADGAILQDKDVTVVIDAGEDGQAIANYLHQKRQRVETLIITHLHTDHGGGIRALLDEGIPVEVCYLPWDAEVPIIDDEMLPLIEELAATGTEFRYLRRGDVMPLPSGQLTVLWPEAGRISALHDANEVNLVLQADIAGVTMLLTADLPGEYEPYITLPADILKVAHHGSKDSTTADFLTAVAPQVMLQSNRLESREIHMAEVAGEIPLYSTEKHGAIIIRFIGDGEFTVETVK